MTEELWRVELLGGLRAKRGPELVTKLRTKNAELLLAMLSVRPGRAWGREELGERLWPDTEPALQRERLRYELSQLRHALGPDCITRGGHTSVAASPSHLSSDVATFDTALLRAVRASSPLERLEPLRDAVALYTGDLLPGFYDDWSCSERERLREGLFDALTRLMLDLSSLGRHEEARASRRDALVRFPDRLLPELDIPTTPLPASTPSAWEGRYFGRDAEKEKLASWLQQSRERLLTLVGPGGIGKTRLAREATAGMGAQFVSLADVFEPERLYEALHSALELPPHQGDPYLPVVTRLRSQEAPFLLLDNLEQIATEAAPRVARLLRDVPDLKLLVTSRKRLALPDERIMALNPLPDEASVALFLDRARLARPDFAQSRESLALIEQICNLLEGLPLAIELCAARTVVLGPRQILSQLQSRLTFLVNRRHAPVERHRSLRTALDWSFELLPDDLKQFFARLSVFRGGFTLEAAETVAGACVPSTLDALDDLHAHSLITVRFDEQGEAHYDLLVVIREYAEELLEDPGVQAAHATYFDNFTDRCVGLPTRAALVTLLFTEIDNVRAAVSYSITQQDTDTIYRYLDRLGGVLFEAGLWHDMQALMGALKKVPLDPNQRMRYVSLQGALARRQGREDDAAEWWKEWVHIAQQSGNLREIKKAINNILIQNIEQKNHKNAEFIFSKYEHLFTDDIFAYNSYKSMIFSISGNQKKAIQYINDLFQQIPDITSIMIARISLVIYNFDNWSESNHKEALSTWLRECLTQNSRAGNIFLSGILLEILSNEQLRENNIDKARQSLSLSLCLLESIGARQSTRVRSKWKKLNPSSYTANNMQLSTDSWQEKALSLIEYP